jgi:hypothetical protein
MRFQIALSAATIFVMAAAAHAQSAAHPSSDPDFVALRSSSKIEARLDRHSYVPSSDMPWSYEVAIKRGHRWGRCVVQRDRETAVAYLMNDQSLPGDATKFQPLFEACKRKIGGFYQDDRPVILKAAIRDALAPGNVAGPSAD